MPGAIALSEQGDERRLTAIDRDAFRTALGHFLTGVTIVTTTAASGEPVGLTANAFTSVSLDPPLVMVCVARSAASFRAMARAERFAVHILHRGQHELSSAFARSAATGAEKFAGIAWHPSEDGVPLLDECLARVECAAARRITLGDHVAFVGHVYGAWADQGAPPLGFFRGRYADLVI
jgi:3-hydroxy-9,10-secoandrosta-1,3,5(10)-triene-9,17-dione monooxygenase reductase component